MRARMFITKTFNTALLVGAIALSAQQAFAFGAMGAMGGVGGAHVGGMGSMGSVRAGSIGGRVGATNVPGSITMNGITVLPSGAVLVPAVTPRVQGTATGGQLNTLNPLGPTGGPCSTPVCAP